MTETNLVVTLPDEESSARAIYDRDLKKKIVYTLLSIFSYAIQVNAKDIGVIAPYRRQVQKIR